MFQKTFKQEFFFIAVVCFWFLASASALVWLFFYVFLAAALDRRGQT